MNKEYLIELSSGLGNQIYQYALFLYLRQEGYKCYLHAHKSMLLEHNGLELQKVFPVSALYITTKRKLDIIFRLYQKTRFIRGVLKSYFPIMYLLLRKFTPWRVVIFPSWKNYCFIDDIKDKANLFRFQDLDNRNQQLYETIKSENSISIHVRRGDFQKYKRWRINLGDICTLDYYQKAIDYVLKVIPNPVFYVFSDDPDWVRNNFKLEFANYIDWNKGDNSYKDMQLMTACKVNICANSTFSLIGAWLNINADSKRIVPSKWINSFKDYLFESYIPKNNSRWIIIDNRKPQVSLIPQMNLTSIELHSILNQSYTDFEILLKEIMLEVNDDRVKIGNDISGNYILHIDDIHKFNDKNYLKQWVLDQYVDSI